MWYTQKMQEQTGLNCANEQRENWEQRKTCSKKKSSIVEVVANGVYTAKLETKITYEGGRESN
jgi:hypothetical protein